MGEEEPIERPGGVTELRRLLSGPILRRTERASVAIWLATSGPATPAAEIYCERGGEWTLIGGGGAETIRLGRRLFVHLITARPEGEAFPADELLAYDIVLNGGGSAPEERLKDLSAHVAYAGMPLPTFFIREKTPQLTILHGSCRELHGDGEDALAKGDEIVAGAVRDLSKRPCALFLTGDQIYADDVAGPLMAVLRGLAGRLLEGEAEESIPGLGPTSGIGIYDRAGLAESLGFTSEKASNHLISFGEFAAMYVMTWSNAEWPASFPAPEEALRDTRRPRAGLARLRRKYSKEVATLEEERPALPAIRRLMANTPTYMIFDDHDVTDDWNLTRKVRRGVHESPAGRRTVSNALAAYWAFQGWGNDPSRFDDGFKQTIVAFLNREQGVDGDDFDQTMWSFDKWGFHAPTTPPAIFLDTRTQRQYESENGAAHLVGEKGRAATVELAERAGHTAGAPLIIVSPVPLFGLQLQERRQKYVASRLRATKVDLEAWHSNVKGLVEFWRLMAEELKLKQCIVLSGDVHYGMNVRARFAVGGAEVECAQLVSSAMRHSGAKGEYIFNLMGRLVGREHELYGWNHPPEVDGKAPGLKRRVLRRPANVDDWDSNSPVLLARDRASQLGIKKPPDFRESKTHIALSNTATVLVGDNNIGLVTVHDGVVTHELLTPTLGDRKAEVMAGEHALSGAGPEPPPEEGRR